MIRFLLVAAAFVLTGAADAPVGFDQHRTVVRLFAGAQAICSAVVIRPGVLRSADHCFTEGEADAVEQGGTRFPITERTPIGQTDGTIVTAPGIACPCAVVDLEVATEGERVVAAGYPGSKGIVVAEGRVLAHGTVADYVAPLLPFGPCPLELWICTIPQMFHTAYTAPGMSGGGVFAYRGTRWVLIGVNTLRVDFLSISGATALWMN